MTAAAAAVMMRPAVTAVLTRAHVPASGSARRRPQHQTAPRAMTALRSNHLPALSNGRRAATAAAAHPRATNTSSGTSGMLVTCSATGTVACHLHLQPRAARRHGNVSSSMGTQRMSGRGVLSGGQAAVVEVVVMLLLAGQTQAWQTAPLGAGATTTSIWGVGPQTGPRQAPGVGG
jgi:hypothetical protein